MVCYLFMCTLDPYIIFKNTCACPFFCAGIDDGTNLAAPGIVWEVQGASWEVLFTGSVSWKRRAGKNNRSHKLPLSGPHLVFVRRSEHMGKPIAWDHIQKFFAQRFFDKGLPAREVTKANLAKAVELMNNFLEDVRNPRIWSDIEIVRERKQAKRTDVQDPYPVKRTSKRILRSNAKRGLCECACVCVRVRVCVGVCVWVCVCVGACVGAGVCECGCVGGCGPM